MRTEWPDLNYSNAKDTYETIHLWTQVIGKIKLAKLPWINHSWHVTLIVTPAGLTTCDLPDTNKHFQINFDFIDHKLRIKTSEGRERSIGLPGLSVAGFYKKVFAALKELDIQAEINVMPNEVKDPIPLNEDETHAVYNTGHASSLHRALLNIAGALTEFRAEFTGKCSPVHFFWGSFDLAVSRFSGREAPPHPGGIPNLPDWVAREAYSHEVSSCGFWPGNEAVPFAAFYSYIYPEPRGYKEAAIQPEQAYYHSELGEFILPYKAVQRSGDPSGTLMQFLHSTYRAGADLAGWDVKNFERKIA